MKARPDTELAGELALRALALLVGPRDLGAEVRRVGFHAVKLLSRWFTAN
jgi:hypothetical protein